MNKTRKLVETAVIAAIYLVLTYIFSPISFGPVQVRVAEALTILPVFTVAAVPGLFIGCLLSNLLLGGLGWIDIVFGSAATLIAALLTYLLRRHKLLAPLPPVLVNAVIIGIELHYFYAVPMLEIMGSVALGQFVACYMLGYPLILLLGRYREHIFPQRP